MPSHTRPHDTMQCPAVLPSTASHRMVPHSTPQAASCDTTEGAPGPPPHHESLVDRVTELEDVVADSQVVLQAEGLQYHAVPHREGQSQLLAGGWPWETPPSGKPTPSPSGPSHTPGMPQPRPAHCTRIHLAGSPTSATPHPETAVPRRKLLPLKVAPSLGATPLRPLWRKPIPPKIPPARSRKPRPIQTLPIQMVPP